MLYACIIFASTSSVKFCNWYVQDRIGIVSWVIVFHQSLEFGCIVLPHSPFGVGCVRYRVCRSFKNRLVLFVTPPSGSILFPGPYFLKQSLGILWGIFEFSHKVDVLERQVDGRRMFLWKKTREIVRTNESLFVKPVYLVLPSNICFPYGCSEDSSEGFCILLWKQDWWNRGMSAHLSCIRHLGSIFSEHEPPHCSRLYQGKRIRIAPLDLLQKLLLSILGMSWSDLLLLGCSDGGRLVR